MYKKYKYHGPLTDKESAEALERMRIKPRAIHDYDWEKKKFIKRK
jgi:hypothetical protein